MGKETIYVYRKMCTRRGNGDTSIQEEVTKIRVGSKVTKEVVAAELVAAAAVAAAAVTAAAGVTTAVSAAAVARSGGDIQWQRLHTS